MCTMAPKGLRIHVPDYYRCPISLDLMRDPVILSTGQTYDRSSIEKWMSQGNLICPVTKQPLEDLSLIPNNMLLRLIQGWCVANKSLGVERIPTPKQPASPEQVALLVHEIASNGSRRAKVDALQCLRNMAKESEKNRCLIAEMGVVPVLMSAVFSAAIEGECRIYDEVTEEALGSLIYLRLRDKDRDELAESQKLSFLSYLLRYGNDELRINAGLLVEALASSEEASDEIRCNIGTTEGMIQGFVGLVRKTDYPRAMKVGIKALFASSLANSNLERAVAAGAPCALVECLSRVDKSDAERALATIELLCKMADARERITKHALAVPLLKKMLLNVSNQASENAAGILLVLCNHSEQVQEAALEAGILTHLLLLLQSGCTCRAKKKARILLKLLTENWADHPCVKALGRTDGRV
eukprot:c21507_g1_i1 orf=679-1920(+)